MSLAYFSVFSTETRSLWTFSAAVSPPVYDNTLGPVSLGVGSVCCCCCFFFSCGVGSVLICGVGAGRSKGGKTRSAQLGHDGYAEMGKKGGLASNGADPEKSAAEQDINIDESKFTNE